MHTNGQPDFLCPACNAAASNRLLHYFLQSETSFYSKGSKNILESRTPHYYLQNAVNQAQINAADFILFDDSTFLNTENISKQISLSRPGSCFIFACIYPNPTEMQAHLNAIFQSLKLKINQVDFIQNLTKEQRLYHGITVDIRICKALEYKFLIRIAYFNLIYDLLSFHLN
jgi:hypothetical protein